MYVYIYICMYVYMYVCIYIYICMYVCMYIDTCLDNPHIVFDNMGGQTKPITFRHMGNFLQNGQHEDGSWLL